MLNIKCMCSERDNPTQEKVYLLTQNLANNWWIPIALDCRESAKNAHFEAKQLKVDSQQAYFAGEGALAKELSNKAKEQKDMVEKFNTMAANTIYLGNNHDLDDSMIDLDGLFKNEAVKQLNRKVKQGSASSRNHKEIKCLLKTNKSSDFEIDRMKRIVREYCDDNNYSYREENNDGGYVVISFDHLPLQSTVRIENISLSDYLPVENLT